ncbi:alanine--glyoxylate aminotransferase family protein [Methanohalobium sp.]|uniref:pyridoxal-phosphate-dependent aminotransferase family protein n=1 Tax=Methanohalobium sp. TaxID=2837493 RepID=UPI0025CDAE25|nr:alanine--glyoxylate aminotransferase family protein [Methanohalobium sp.]
MNFEDKLIMMPGPVPVAPRILRAMSKPMINHRGDEFAEIYDDCCNILKDVFNTQNDISVISGSGSAGMEAAIGCTTNDNDNVITIENGKFGERFKLIADRYGNALPVESEWGEPVDLDKVENLLAEGATSVAMVHNETSAGVLNPAKEVGKLTKKYDALFIMDGITSIGGDEVKVDDWGVDIAIAGSQKCIGAPPGMSMVSISDRAYEAMENVDNKPYYLDLEAYKESLDKDKTQTPYTPALPLFYGLQESLHIVNEEGVDNRINRHRTYSKAVRSAMDAIGLEMYPILDENTQYSNTVSAMSAPESVSGEDIKKDMLERGIVIVGGQERLKNKIFRIGNMGNLTSRDILITIQELETILHKRGIISEVGAGINAANDILDSL